MTVSVRPLLAPVGRPVCFCFRAEFPFSFKEGGRYAVRCTPLSGIRRYALSKAGRAPDETACAAMGVKHPAAAQGGMLRLTLALPQEDEYKLCVYDEEGRTLQTLKVYALEDDLYGTYPLKGDTHTHTCRSDGVESPAYVAAMCRKQGMDFTAVTDHGWYAPSEEAVRYWSVMRTDFQVLCGEEVHAPDARAHILNIGGSASVNAWAYGREADYRRAVEEKRRQIPDVLCEPDRLRAAASLAVFDKIREYGGLSVLCHPFWETDEGYDISRDLTEWLLDHRAFDALEVIGGYWRHEYRSNHFQTAFYHQYCLHAGGSVPVLGESDSHGTDAGGLHGWYYSVVFARDFTFDAIREAVCAGRSVGVTALPGDIVRAYGPMRYVQYAAFLAEQVFPGHDAICRTQGDWMRQYLMGAAERLENLNGEPDAVRRYYDALAAERDTDPWNGKDD
ncbi:MAG TPA: hypothetical protein H9684_06020 [Firmicutes bacterium]|nr:hypothetical protein [Bacillota bacterium]